MLLRGFVIDKKRVMPQCTMPRQSPPPLFGAVYYLRKVLSAEMRLCKKSTVFSSTALYPTERKCLNNMMKQPWKFANAIVDSAVVGSRTLHICSSPHHRKIWSKTLEVCSV